MRVGIQFPSKYFDVKMATINGTYQEIKTLASGTCKIIGQLLGVANKVCVL